MCVCVLVWAMLQCQWWCPWQFGDASRPAGEKVRLRQEQRRSKIMLQLFLRLVDDVSSPCVVVVFEWPRCARAWTFLPEEMRCLCELLPCRADFDACAFGLVSASGVPIRKPWRLQTNLTSLVGPLHKLCDRQHAHVSCRGSWA